MQPLQAYNSSLGPGDASLGSEASSSRLHHRAAAQAFESQRQAETIDAKSDDGQDGSGKIPYKVSTEQEQQEQHELTAAAGPSGSEGRDHSKSRSDRATLISGQDGNTANVNSTVSEPHANSIIAPGSSDSASTDPADSMSMGLFSSRRIARALAGSSRSSLNWAEAGRKVSGDDAAAYLQSTGYDLPVGLENGAGSFRSPAHGQSLSDLQESLDRLPHRTEAASLESSLDGGSEPPVVPDESQLPPTYIPPRAREFERARDAIRAGRSLASDDAYVPPSSLEPPFQAATTATKPVHEEEPDESMDSFVNQADLRANSRLLAARATAHVDVGASSRRGPQTAHLIKIRQNERAERIKTPFRDAAELMAVASEAGEPLQADTGQQSCGSLHEAPLTDLEPTLRLPRPKSPEIQHPSPPAKADAELAESEPRPPVSTPTESQKSEAIRSIPERRKLKRKTPNGAISGADVATEILDSSAGQSRPANALRGGSQEGARSSRVSAASSRVEAAPNAATAAVASLVLPERAPVVKTTYKTTPKPKRAASPGPLPESAHSSDEEAKPGRPPKRQRTSNATDASRPSRITRRRLTSETADRDVDAGDLSPAAADTVPPSAADLRIFGRYSNAFYPATVEREVVPGAGLFETRFDDGSSGTMRASAMRGFRLKRGDTVAGTGAGKKGVFELAEDLTAEHEPDAVKANKPKSGEVIQLSLATMSVAKQHIKQLDGRQVSEERLRAALALAPLRSPSRASSADTDTSGARDDSFADTVFILSGVSAATATEAGQQEVEEIKSIIRRKSGGYVDDIWKVYNKPNSLESNGAFQLLRKSTTVLLLSFDQGVFNAKWMMALALGIPCLSPRFVLDSVANEVDVRSYLLSSGHSVHLAGPASQVVGFDGQKDAHRRPLIGKKLLCVKADELNVSRAAAREVAKLIFHEQEVVLFAAHAMGASISTCKKLQSTTDTSRYDVVIIADKKKPDAEEKKLARTKKLGNVEWLKQCLVSCILCA